MREEVERMLAVVNVSPETLDRLVGSSLRGFNSYLVGSLSAGLGNGSSDIDIHVFDQSRPAGSPLMSFAGNTTVDIRYFSPDDVTSELVNLGVNHVRFRDCRCSLGETLSRKSQARLGRWWYALPINTDSPSLLPSDRALDIRANLVRGAIVDYVSLCALALLNDARRDGNREVAAGAWRKVARALLEVEVRARGDLYLGRKWVWARAYRSGVRSALLEAFDSVRSRAQLQRLEESVGCHGLSNVGLEAEVDADPELQREHIRIAEECFQLLDKRWLLPCLDSVGTVASLLADGVDAHLLLTHIAHGAMSCRIPELVVDEWLQQL